MLNTLVTAQEPFYADYPSYHDTGILTNSHNNSHNNHSQQQHQPHHHQQTTQQQALNRTIMPPVSLDATTHTPGIFKTYFLQHNKNQNSILLVLIKG